MFVEPFESYAKNADFEFSKNSVLPLKLLFNTCKRFTVPLYGKKCVNFTQGLDFS